MTVKITTALLVLLVVVLVALFAPDLHSLARRQKFSAGKVRPVVSKVDGVAYGVHLRHHEPETAADLLAMVYAWSIQAMAILRRKYVVDTPPPDSAARQEIVKNILKRYNPDRLVESSPNNPLGDTSYTIDKGRVLAMCIRDKKPDAGGQHHFIDFGVLAFVKLHEIAHLGVNTNNHTPVFWEAFKFLLLETAGIARAIPTADGQVRYKDNNAKGGWPDFRLHPVDYCGLHLDHNPLYDPNIPVPR
jgi:hypothetical protein